MIEMLEVNVDVEVEYSSFQEIIETENEEDFS